jgi:hypothetical protein
MIWQEALHQVCAEYLNRPLEWGVRDCCQFASAYVQARTGVDHAVDFNYDGRLGAARILAEYDGIEKLIGKYLGAPKHTSNPGDLVLCNLAVAIDEAVQTLGVTNGSYVWGIHPDDGLVRIPLKAIAAAWSV